MPYSAVEDLLTGDIPTPAQLDPGKFVQDAADEIDSKIGFRYATPVNLAQLKRPAQLLLKRLNNILASGRLLLAATASGEQNELHAYAASLITEAQIALQQIVDGQILLQDADLADPNAQVLVTTPLIGNKDSESNVEAFYDRIANPAYSFGLFGESRSGVVGW